ncbi:MAG: serine/threonine protein kinase [Deltaproteobacteria bacterium]|nr:serine/threonine protein kinase [Deltaproteobacteria bacterium]
MGETAVSLSGRTVAGKYRIDEHVGSGAMGDVYRARHVVLDTAIALKIMRADIAKDEMFKERFYREAKAASKLDHPNSVRVLDFGVEEDGLVYIAMEFLHGRDLLTLLREEWPLSDQRIVEILQQTLSAVATAHSLGIVHRDLKPENIMVSTTIEDDGTKVESVKVCDFGIAKLSDSRGFQTEGGKALTTMGTLIGTPEYMSPEQARGDPLDPRSDLYSLGVVLYQLLTGKLPFTAENALGVVLKQVTDEALPPSSVRPGVNPRLEAICKRAMQKPREARYQTAKEMRTDLRNVFGYRQQSTSGEESGPWIPFAPQSHPGMQDAGSVRAMRSVPDAGVAETLVAPVASAPRNDFSPKATSDGTALPPRSSSSAKWIPMVVVAALALVVGIVVSVVLVVKGRSKDDGKGTASSASPATPSSTAASPGSVVATTDPPSPTSTSTLATANPTSTSSPSVPSTKHGTTAVASAPRSPASAKGAPSQAASAPPPPPSAPSAAPTAPAAPFNPASAHVVLGGLFVQRVDRSAMQSKMSSVAPSLSECYRTALRMAGAPVPGSAEIQISIDDRGRMMPVVLAAKHPEFARCAQGVLAGQSVPVSALEGGTSGATATQSLTLVP